MSAAYVARDGCGQPTYNSRISRASGYAARYQFFIACLTKNHKIAVINRLTNDLSTREVASKVGVSHTRVNKVAKRLLGAHVAKVQE
ncbi:hypothetical protein GQ54DRAFT_309491 [Martensiomyces pterosporus]|nr:hypothetical protein GQ54DRAFT_309491 [Martensiomyces pterosporus]